MVVQSMDDHPVKFATAQTFIGIPFMDMNPLVLFLEMHEKTLKQDTNTELYYVPEKLCEDTYFSPIVLHIDGLAFTLPVLQYTRDTGAGCVVLFKIQDEDFDDKGYNLGLPFISAFNIIFDYKNSRIGFGDKAESKIEGISIREYRKQLD